MNEKNGAEESLMLPKTSKKAGLLLGLSFLSGCVNGLFGSGGGIVLIYMLRFLFPKESEKMSFAVSCVTVFFFSAVSATIYATHGTLSFSQAAPYLFPALVGGVFGALLLRVIRTSFLKTLFAFLLIYGGIRMAMG